MRKRYKKKKTFFNILEMIVDIIVYPVIIISFISSFFMLVAKSKNVVSPVFGHTFARVLSNSMSTYCPEAGRNFLKGDIAIIKTNLPEYRVGDVIAFYYFDDSADKKQLINLTDVTTKQQVQYDTNGKEVLDENGKVKYVTNKYAPVTDTDGKVIYDTALRDAIKNAKVGDKIINLNTNETFTKTSIPSNRKTLEHVQDSNASVLFHQIVQIKIDTSGTIFYITKGTSNASTDNKVREDFVVGKYVNTPKWISDVVNFCASTQGMICLVVAPIAFIVLIELLSILEQVNNIILEKKVINREIPFDSKECEKANIGFEMREQDKIFYYDVMPLEYKSEVYDFLWGCLQDGNKKNKTIFLASEKAVGVYNMKNPKKYYQFWRDFFKSKRMLNQIDKAEDRSLEEKYAEVLCIDYQNDIEDIKLEKKEQSNVTIDDKIKLIDKKLEQINTPKKSSDEDKKPTSEKHDKKENLNVTNKPKNKVKTETNDSKPPKPPKKPQPKK